MKRFNGIALSVAFCSLASQAALAQTKIDTLKVQNLNEVIVKGVRAAKEAPYAVANIRKSELKQFSCSGQELPFLIAIVIVVPTTHKPDTAHPALAVRSAFTLEQFL